MKVFISGISGTGMGALALMTQAAGIEVCGTDLREGDIDPELKAAGIETRIGAEAQDGTFLREKLASGVDWLVRTSALPEDQAELKVARAAGVKVSKRDDFTAFLIDKLKLKLVAVAGTHGKTTTTSMIIWAAQRLGIPAAHIVGSTLSFAPSGAYHEGDQYFIYEADEYDRNFLKFRPWLAVVPTVSYDHPDIYPTVEDYRAAFRQFLTQSRKWVAGPEVKANLNVGKGGNALETGEKEKTLGNADGTTERTDLVAKLVTRGEFAAGDFTLAGAARREDAALAGVAVRAMSPKTPKQEIVRVLNEFPGVGRRFERLAEGIYTDYAHHPEEIAATLEMAREEAERKGFSGVTAVYEPHQNTRQHEVRKGYREAFQRADKIFWLPTYLTREDETLPVLEPEELVAELTNREAAEVARADDELFEKILAEQKAGRLVVLMTAGPADRWLRRKLSSNGDHGNGER